MDRVSLCRDGILLEGLEIGSIRSEKEQVANWVQASTKTGDGVLPGQCIAFSQLKEPLANAT